MNEELSSYSLYVPRDSSYIPSIIHAPIPFALIISIIADYRLSPHLLYC